MDKTYNARKKTEFHMDYCIYSDRYSILFEADIFLRNIFTRYKTIVVIYDTARRQLVRAAFGKNSLRRIGYSVIIQRFQYF